MHCVENAKYLAKISVRDTRLRSLQPCTGQI